MKSKTFVSALFIVMLFLPFFRPVHSSAQVGVFSKEALIEYTPEWKGERFPDGRPMVPDNIIERMKKVSLEEAWSVLGGEGFKWQYEGGWQLTHPGQILVGRAVTAVYMPRRPDMRKIMDEKGKNEGRIGDQISWPIDVLVKGDVYVADVFGLVQDGPIIGDNLAMSIFTRSGNGVVFDGSIRDLEGLEEMPTFPCFVRGWHPGYSAPTIMLMGINAPIRIGRVTVMPGDVVLAKREGIVFIPPHLAEKVVKTSEIVRLRDAFGHLRLSEKKYTPGQIDAKWTDEIEKDFSQWLKNHINELPVPKESIQEFLKERTW